MMMEDNYDVLQVYDFTSLPTTGVWFQLSDSPVAIRAAGLSASNKNRYGQWSHRMQ